MTPQEFVAKWRPIANSESASAQTHFNDLCALLGVRAPIEDDPEGTHYTFERGAEKLGGGQGWADVWKKGCFGWEYKGPGRDLDKAYRQLLLYKDALENPPLLIVSDILTIVVQTNFTNSVKRVETFTLDDLLIPSRLDLLRCAWTDPDAYRVTGPTTEEVTEDAARKFARLADMLRERGADPSEAAHFLIRLLFCLFAEDVGLLPARLFTRLVDGAGHDSSEFTALLADLFGKMRSGGRFGVEKVPFFNGGLFDSAAVLDVGSDGLAILREICQLDWGAIEPAILGTLFERSLDPSKRSQLGAHYTSREDILLIVEPVLMAPLRRRWADVQSQARVLAARRNGASGAQRTKLHNELTSLLTGFAAEIASVRVLDPACGSGNFLYVSLRQLLDLEKQVVTEAADLGVGAFFPSVDPVQLHGIEINEYAHELAQATIWIGYIQWLRENGFGAPGEPILKPIETVRQMDAILAYDEAGRPVEPDWPEADAIVGNPPFLGDRRMKRSLGEAYVEHLRALYAGRLPPASDLVCYWFEKARALVAAGKVRRVGLLATQAIRGGRNRTVLDRIDGSGAIFWALSDHDWLLDGATVHVSMIGFDAGREKERCLDGKRVERVNPDLTSASDLTAARCLPENRGIAFVGVQRSGPFEIDAAKASEFLRRGGNPTGKRNDEVVKPWINALDVARRPRGMWIIDFGELPIELAAEYEAPFEYVRAAVLPARREMGTPALLDRWWQFWCPRPSLREAIRGLERCIVTPMVAKHRLFVWIATDVVAENLLIVIARSDDYFIGVLHSKTHELWSRRLGTQLREAESGTRYTPSSTFMTFPFPWPPGHEPVDDPRVIAIADAARDLVEKRDRWLNPEGATYAELKKHTLTNLYNARPMWLDLAHRRLDEAVFDAYGWPHDLADEEILERLLALNLERAGASGSTV